MNDILTNKHFIIFCYIQDIVPNEESYDLYKSYQSPLYKNVEDAYQYVVSVQIIDPKLIIDKYAGCPINPKHYTYFNGSFDFNAISIEEYNDLNLYTQESYKVNPGFGISKSFARLNIPTNSLKSILNSLIPPLTIELLNKPSYADLLKLPYTDYHLPIPRESLKQWDLFNTVKYNVSLDVNLLSDVCETRLLKEFYTTGMSLWQSGYILYKNKVILFFQGYGSTSSLDYNFTVVDKELYEELSKHILTLMGVKEHNQLNIQSLNSEACIECYDYNLLTTRFEWK